MTAQFKTAVADETVLRKSLENADIVPTLLVHAQLSGDTRLLDEAAPYITGAWSFNETIPDDLKARARNALVDALKDYAASGRTPPQALGERLQHLMSAAVGQPVPAEYVPLLTEEMRIAPEDTRTVAWRSDSSALPIAEMSVVIVGAGFAGLCAAIRLQQIGIPFVVLEKNDNVGGTWYENTYPGVGVDTPNHFFSYSFFPYNDWPHHFSKGAEIQSYIEKTADHFAIRRHVRFGVEVTSAVFDERTARWTISCRNADGGVSTLSSKILITAVGQLNRAAVPDIKGLDRFKGAQFHTAHWDHSVDLEGKRVVMIGTGASGMQAGPSIAGDVAKLTIFQRSPHWAMPNQNYHKAVTDGQRWALNHIPFFSEWARFLLFWASSDGFHASLQMDPAWTQPDVSLNEANHRMRETIVAHIRAELDGDETLIAKCVPTYPPYGKRMLRDNQWFRMLKRPNVELVTDGISHVTENAVVAVDGTTYEADVIVLATGFQAAKILWPMRIEGPDGKTIRDIWGDDDPRAYLGITVPGFPNLFVTFGPNTNLAHGGSAIFHFECQIHYITQALREMVERGVDTIEVKRDVFDRYNALVDEKCRNMVWSHPGVTNWYKNKDGRVTVTSPWRLVDYWRLTHDFDPSEFVMKSAPAELRKAS